MKNEVYEMVVLELFEDICPKTCKNFIELCKGFERDSKTLGYTGSEFDRIVPGSFVQGGNLRKTMGKYNYKKHDLIIYFILYFPVLYRQRSEIIFSL